MNVFLTGTPDLACLHVKPPVCPFHFCGPWFLHWHRWFAEDSMRQAACRNLRLLERQFTECLVRFLP